MSFAQGFSAGAALADSIKREKLDREMLTLRKQQAADDIELRKQLAAQRAQQVADDLALRRDDLTLRRDDLGFRRENAAAGNARADAQLSANRMNAIMGQFGRMRADKEQHQANIDRRMDRIYRNSEHGASGGAGGKAGAWRTVRREDPETGEVTTERYPIEAPTAGAAQQPLPPTDPTAAAAQAEIKKLQAQIGANNIAIAKGDNRDGFWNNWSLPRTGENVNLQKQIDALTPLAGLPAPSQGGTTAAPVTTAAQQPQPGTVAVQNGKRYRFDGSAWVAIP